MTRLTKAQRIARDALIAELREEKRFSLLRIAQQLNTTPAVIRHVCLRDGVLHPTRPPQIGRLQDQTRRGRPVRRFTEEEDRLLVMLSRQLATPTQAMRALCEHGFVRGRQSVWARLCTLARHDAYREEQEAA